MNGLFKLVRQTPGDRWLLVKTLALVAGVRGALCVLPFRVTCRIAARLGRPAEMTSSAPSSGRLAWAVSAAARRVPAATCLTQAIALQILCRRYGYLADLQIGVNRDDNQRFRAHAWVESRGEILIGRLANLAAYLPLPSVGI